MKTELFLLALTVLHTVYSSYPGGGSNSVFSNTFSHNSGSSSYQNSGGSSYYSHSHNSVDPCPVFTDFSAELQLSSDNTGYPDAAIADGLTNLAATLPIDCLLALPPAPPVPQDPSLVYSHETCPSVTPPLSSFYRGGAKCWIVRDLENPRNFTICRTTRCLTCDDTFSYGVQSRCIPQYRYVSVWAFCEDVNQIIRERIAIPESCSCKKIHCASNPWGKKK